MSDLPSGPLRIALFGAGRVATAVATLLQEQGHSISGVASPTQRSADRAAVRLGAPAVSPVELTGADVVLIGAPEAQLAPAVQELGRAADGAVLVHFAGSTGISPLLGAERAAAHCALHPVQACPDVDSAIKRLPGSAWGVTCSEHARGWAHTLIADDLEGSPVDVSEEDRVLWHAAAVTTSNGISALMATGELLLAGIGVGRPADILGPIAAGTVTNAREVGGGGPALTGPVVRGEVDVIVRHADAVAERVPDLDRAYRDAVLSIVSGAEASGRIAGSVATEIRRVLG